MTISSNAAHLARWNAYKTGIPYNAEFGIPTFWRQHPELGSPLAREDQEEGAAAGVTIQAFVGGVVRWVPGVGAEIVVE